jgi:membrane protein
MVRSTLNTDEQLHSIWELGGLTWRQLAKRVWQGIDEHNLLGRASELAYNYILAIFPLLLFLISLFGLFAARGTQLESSLLFYLSRVVPPTAFEVVSKTIAEVTRGAGGAKLTFGIVFALWSAAGGMTSMISALNGASQVRESRPWWKVRLIAIGLTVAISMLLISALGLVLIGGHAAELAGAKLHLGPLVVVIWKVIQWPAALFFVVISFSIIYFFGPSVQEQHWYWITPGSVVGVLTWLAVSFAFRAYLHFFNSYSKTYGSLGAAMILLVWFYVTGLAFLAGGEINAQIEHAAAHRGHPEAKAEGEKVSPEGRRAA